jgi:AMIN domain
MTSFRGIAAKLGRAWPLAVFLLPAATGQSQPQTPADGPIAVVRSVRALPDRDGPALEIIASRPLTPAISKLDNPPRLVIDLPGARLSGVKRQIPFRSREIKGVRLSQLQDAPPVTRIVVDLAEPIAYTWDAAGNRLMIRLRAAEAAAKKPTVPDITPGVQLAAAPLSSASSGAVVLAGSRIAAGSSVTAGSGTAVLRLGRGGEVRVCPGTTVSVTPSQSGHSLMLGMGTGALEAHYTLDASSDSILTPDLRILLAGPGEFHYGISADSRGNTCVQALPGNTASVIVTELLGDGTYQVKPTEQVVFRSGQVKRVDSVIPAVCGCPPPAQAIMRASAEPESFDKSSLPSASSLVASSAPSPETAALPLSKPSDVHIQVEAPLVFRADDTPAAKPAPTREAELLPIRDRQRPAWLQAVALPPPKPHRSVFGKIKGFFAAIFG